MCRVIFATSSLRLLLALRGHHWSAAGFAHCQDRDWRNSPGKGLDTELCHLGTMGTERPLQSQQAALLEIKTSNS